MQNAHGDWVVYCIIAWICIAFALTGHKFQWTSKGGWGNPFYLPRWLVLTWFLGFAGYFFYCAFNT